MTSDRLVSVRYPTDNRLSRCLACAAALLVLPFIAVTVQHACPSYMTSYGKFIRGDGNNDGVVGMADAIYILNWAYQGGPAPPCNEDAADVDDDGELQGTTDATYLLNHLFQGGPAPPSPYPDSGYDTTADDIDPCSSPQEGTPEELTVADCAIAQHAVQGGVDAWDNQQNEVINGTLDATIRTWNDSNCTRANAVNGYTITWFMEFDSEGITKRESREPRKWAEAQIHWWHLYTAGGPCTDSAACRAGTNQLSVEMASNVVAFVFENANQDQAIVTASGAPYPSKKCYKQLPQQQMCQITDQSCGLMWPAIGQGGPWTQDYTEMPQGLGKTEFRATVADSAFGDCDVWRMVEVRLGYVEEDGNQNLIKYKFNRLGAADVAQVEEIGPDGMNPSFQLGYVKYVWSEEP
jgi:hypothetical protein